MPPKVILWIKDMVISLPFSKYKHACGELCSPQAYLITSIHLPFSLGTGSLYTPVSVVHIFPARSGHCLTPDHSLSDWSSLFRKYNSCNILHGICLLSFSIGSTTPLTGILRRKFARCFPRSFSSVSTFELKTFIYFTLILNNVPNQQKSLPDSAQHLPTHAHKYLVLLHSHRLSQAPSIY